MCKQTVNNNSKDTSRRLPVVCRDFRLSPCLTSRPWKLAYCV